MSTKPKKIKELKKQSQQEEVNEAPKNKIDLASALSIFFILLYAFGVYTNLRAGNIVMAIVWLVLICINVFFIMCNRRRK